MGEPDITLQQLYDWADELAMKHWGVKYIDVIEIKNRRWKYVNGRFLRSVTVFAGEEVPPIIQMCSKRNSERTHEAIQGTLLHELTHWRLFTQGIPHRDINNEFIEECIRVGAPISQASKAKRAYESYIRKDEGK